MKMTLADIIALSKSGYKKKDIDELLAMELPEEDPEPESPEKTPEHGDQDQEEPEADKESMDNIKEENEKLKAQLEQLQKENREKDRTDPADTEAARLKRLQERAKQFM